jgi:hypothetical protein
MDKDTYGKGCSVDVVFNLRIGNHTFDTVSYKPGGRWDLPLWSHLSPIGMDIPDIRSTGPEIEMNANGASGPFIDGNNLNQAICSLESILDDSLELKTLTLNIGQSNNQRCRAVLKYVCTHRTTAESFVLDRPDLPNAPNNSHTIVQQSSDGRKLLVGNMICHNFELVNLMARTQIIGAVEWSGREDSHSPIDAFDRFRPNIGGEGFGDVIVDIGWWSHCGEEIIVRRFVPHLDFNYHKVSSIVSCDAFPSTQVEDRFMLSFTCDQANQGELVDKNNIYFCDSCAAVNGREFQLVEGLGRCCDVGSTGFGELRRRAESCSNPKACHFW